MKKILSQFLLYCICCNYTIAQLTADQIYSKINNAIVIIYTFNENNNPIAQGSGVVINQKGWVVTNYHVAEGAAKIIVKQKNKILLYSNIVASDPDKDILVLKINNNIFPHVVIGNSDGLKVGQKIYTIGSPLGFENSITEGIISGLRNNNRNTKSFIQISAAISPGSSGGAVLNTKGELVAITTLTFTKGQNLNFAVPIKEVLNLINRIPPFISNPTTNFPKKIPEEESTLKPNDNVETNEKIGFKSIHIGDNQARYAGSLQGISTDAKGTNTYKYNPTDPELYNVFDLKINEIHLSFNNEYRLVEITLIKSYFGSNSLQDVFSDQKIIDPNLSNLFGKQTGIIDINTSKELKIGRVWKTNKVTVKSYAEDYGLNQGTDLKISITDNELIKENLKSGF